MIPLTGFGTAFVAINIALIFLLPRRWAALPFLVGTCYMVLSQGIKIGPFNFFVIRLLILAGIARVILRGEWLANGMNGMDRLMLLWATWALFSSIFHTDPTASLKYNLGLVGNSCGIYFLLRCFVRSMDDVVRLFRITVILLMPVAFEMILENLTAHNMFSVLGGVAETPNIREDSVRAQGPFGHAILAGTVGAVSLPLAIGLWQRYRITAVIGILACAAMVFASSSSGPIMSSLVAIGALLMWRYRDKMRLFRWFAILGYIALELVMNRPAYYIMTSLDLTGGSTGWHRARLIESAFEHIGEWWLGGTDYTRHWMPTGVSWSADHADITNHYLAMGIVGGLPLMLLYIATLAMGFHYVGRVLRKVSNSPKAIQFMVWALGSSLATHAVTCISISYFDQSFIFLYFALAAISSTFSVAAADHTLSTYNHRATGATKHL